MGKVVALGLVALLFAPGQPAARAGGPAQPSGAGRTSASAGIASVSAVEGTLPETARVVFPLPAGTWVRTSGFGMRVHPITGEYKLHTGVDFAAPAGRTSSRRPTVAWPSPAPPRATATSS